MRGTAAGTRPAVLLVGKGAPDRGGIRTFLDMLSTGSLTRHVDVAVLNLAHAGAPEGGRPTWGNVRRTVRDSTRLLAAARQRDVVHLNTALAPGVTALRCGLLVLAARAAGSRVVVQVHGGLLESWLTTRARHALLRSALRGAHRVVAVSSGGRRALARVVDQARLELVPNGVDVGADAPRSGAHDPPRILYVGLLTPRKGVLDLVEAGRLLRARGAPHEIVLVGGTPDEGAPAEREVRAALDGDVRALGTVAHERMPAVYATADVFCLPSWWEAMPLTVLEAMASGRAVVATDVGDVSRIVDHGRTGLVVPPRDPPALAAALESLLADPDRRERMGRAGRLRVVEQFSRERMEDDVGRIYSDVLSGRR